MKKLLILSVLLSGCSSTPKQLPVRHYECAIVGGHGVWAHMDVGAHYIEQAEEITEQVRKRLADMEKIPKETGVMCILSKEQFDEKSN